ncbi:DUF3050 domain-containing protein [Streptomyces sp. NPDC052236]|uniref:DUF3050 domain-containing protein n=1 Tax=Streptomyces sp. NPDC052236 TaxID=3365686 RepID=UPI0037D90CF0
MACRMRAAGGNGIVLVEESDELGGGFISHFELCRAGVTEAGAGAARINGFLAGLADGDDVPGRCGPPKSRNPCRAVPRGLCGMWVICHAMVGCGGR